MLETHSTQYLVNGISRVSFVSCDNVTSIDSEADLLFDGHAGIMCHLSSSQ